MIQALVAWFSSGSERRAKAFAIVGVVLFAVAGAGLMAASSEPRLAVDEYTPAENTVIALQGYQYEGKVVEVNPEGEVVWEYDRGHKFFDVEVLGPERVQMAVADEVPEDECPPEFQNDGYNNCLRNSLRIVDRESKETVWEYSWFDAKMHSHELHDADHYTVDGEDRWVLVDMGRDRVFALNREQEVVWQWNATDTYDRPGDVDPQGDWTHMNDIQVVEPGVYQVSIRNFNTVVELHVDETTGDIEVVPIIGSNEFRGDSPLYEQHNPDRLADDHVLVADSENHRILEFDGDRNVVWEWGGSQTLNWPRDADRQPNGHTLVTDSYNNRVVEVDDNGEIVWVVETGTLPYDADRITPSQPQGGSSDRPTATDAGLPSHVDDTLLPVEWLQFGEAMVWYILPPGIAAQIYLVVAGVFAILLAGVEGYRWRC